MNMTYMQFYRIAASLVAIVLTLPGCANHGGQTTAAASLNAARPRPQVLLLGEVHDNPQAHRQRYELLRERVEAIARARLRGDRQQHEDSERAQRHACVTSKPRAG